MISYAFTVENSTNHSCELTNNSPFYLKSHYAFFLFIFSFCFFFSFISFIRCRIASKLSFISLPQRDWCHLNGICQSKARGTRRIPIEHNQYANSNNRSAMWFFRHQLLYKNFQKTHWENSIRIQKLLRIN